MTGLTLEKAVDLLKAKAAGAPADGRVLGDHPDGGKIAARAGRFGPYVSWEKVNATLAEKRDARRRFARTGDPADRGPDRGRRRQGPEEAGEKSPGQETRRQENFGQEPAVAAKKPAAKVAKAKTDIVDSDDAPFEGGARQKSRQRKGRQPRSRRACPAGAFRLWSDGAHPCRARRVRK